MRASEATCLISCIRFLGFQQCLKANDTPTDDLDDVILDRMVKEVGMFYKMKLGEYGRLSQ